MQAKDSDRYKVANYTQAQPVVCGLVRVAHDKVISVSVLSVYFNTNVVGTLTGRSSLASRTLGPGNAAPRGPHDRR